jgi:hypothetical protein
MGKSILIIGEDPAELDFSAPSKPKGISAATLMGRAEPVRRAARSGWACGDAAADQGC